MNTVEKFVQENKDEQLKLLRELCAIPAPSHFEDERAEYCRKWLTANGADGVYIDGAKNTVFPYLCDGSDRITVLCAHTDTVFPDRESMPFSDDGEIMKCPGIGDDTASLVALLHTAKYFVQSNIKPVGGVLFVCNSCEEGLGNLKGTRRIFEDYKGRVKQFMSFDASQLDRITDRCVGSHRYRVCVDTEGGHSFGKFGNENAIFRLSEIVNKIYSVEVPVKENCKTTYNVGEITGGTSVNTIAAHAEMLCEYRSDDADCLAYMQDRFKRIFADSASDKVKVSVTLVGERPCGSRVNEKDMDRLESVCEGVITEVTGKRPCRRSGSTDCNIPASLGVPAICVGVYNGGGAHSREEWLEKSSLPVGLKAAILYAIRLTEE